MNGFSLYAVLLQCLQVTFKASPATVQGGHEFLRSPVEGPFPPFLPAVRANPSCGRDPPISLPSLRALSGALPQSGYPFG